MRLAFAAATVAACLACASTALAHEGGPPGHDHGASASDDGAPPGGLPPEPAPAQVEDAEFAAPEAEEEAPAEVAPARRRTQDGEGGTDDEFARRHKDIPDTSWRRRIRDTEPGDENAFIDPTHFHVEVRFAPYSPRVDEEPSLTRPVFEEFFGGNPKFYFGLELDWLPLYIPYVGSIGAGFGWGWTRASGNTRLADGSEAEDVTTALTIFPMHASGIIRLDGLVRDLHIPIVPYGKIGFGFAPWDVSAPSDNTVNGVSANGLSWGLHAAVGGAIALNGFDQAAAMTMKEETGIRFAYIWAEWMGDFLGEFSDDQMYVGTSTVALGIGLDF